MGKIIQFSQEWGKISNEDAILMLANHAICDSTDELLIDGETIEDRLMSILENDTIENKISLVTGLCFFNSAYVIGKENSWKEYKSAAENAYFIFTDLDKIPTKHYKKRNFTEISFRIFVERLSDESNEVELYINPGNKASYIVSLEVIRASLELIDKAIEFADEQMKKGYSGETLTDVMFERYEYRTVEVQLKNGETVRGEVVGTSYGDEPNAHYELELDGQSTTVYRKDIAFIREI